MIRLASPALRTRSTFLDAGIASRLADEDSQLLRGVASGGGAGNRSQIVTGSSKHRNARFTISWICRPFRSMKGNPAD